MFCKNLIQLRKKHNYSQEQLAELTGVTRQAVSKWESGPSSPDIDTILKLADIFGVTVDELLKDCSQKAEGSNCTDLYTILTFIGLCILWITGAAIRIAALFIGRVPSTAIILSWMLMILPVILFLRMLRKHKKHSH